MAKKHKKLKKIEYVEVELNIMPFIDVFSMLNTFLLYSAVFLAIGIHEVQVPFMTNAEPPPQKPTKEFSVKIDVLKEKKVKVTSENAPSGPAKVEKEFNLDKSGMTDMHKYLVGLRKDNVETDKLQLFSDDDITFEQLNSVIDAVKLRWDGDPMFVTKEQREKKDQSQSGFLYPKIVMASVALH